MAAYRLPDGIGSSVIPGQGVVTAGQIITGDYDRLVALGLLVVAQAPAPPREPARAPVPESAPAPERVLTEPAPTPVATELSDTTPTSKAVQADDPFDDLPPTKSVPKVLPKRKR